MLLPKGYLLTPSQIYISGYIIQAPAQILIYNAAFWFIYRNEFAFIEQYKIEPDKAWPWVIDPEGWWSEAF